MMLPQDVVTPHDDAVVAVREYLLDEGAIRPVERLTEVELSFTPESVELTHYVAEPMEGFE